MHMGRYLQIQIFETLLSRRQTAIYCVIYLTKIHDNGTTPPHATIDNSYHPHPAGSAIKLRMWSC